MLGTLRGGQRVHHTLGPREDARGGGACTRRHGAQERACVPRRGGVPLVGAAVEVLLSVVALIPCFGCADSKPARHGQGPPR